MRAIRTALLAVGVGLRRFWRRTWRLVLKYPVYAQALIVATITLGTAFGLGWSGIQVGAVTGLSAAALAFLTGKAVTPLAEPSLPEGTRVTVTTPAGEPDRKTTLR